MLMNLSNSSQKRKILAISSGGGHLTELMHSLNGIEEDITYVVFKTEYTKETLKGMKHHFIIDPHISKVKYLLNAFQALWYYMRIRPNIIISTGAGIAIPMIIIGKKFGSKIVFIETGARVTTPSRTAELCYKYADLFIVQYKPLLEFFPNAKLGTLL